ncbi:MAG TPA: S9 family peptidase [Usitatibacteraceae bacterium]
MRALFVSLLLPLLLIATPPSFAERLTIERLHADPALSGASPRKVKISPDGTRVTFLRGRDDDQFQLDLWEFNLHDKAMRRLVDSKLLKPSEQISDQEKARRERERTASFRGIIDYSWSPDGKRLLVPLAGDLYLVDVAQSDKGRRIATGNVIDPKVSPRGRYVSFVRNQNLYVVDIATGVERQLTKDGAGTIHNAEAEFVAQEEMAQTSGYWWAPDDSAIAFKRFDEAPVPVARRFEIYADRTEVVEQRYPYAGEKNVLVSLAIVALADGSIRPVDLGPDSDIYLVRADWSKNSKQLVYQREARNQQRLDLVSVDAATLVQRILLSETSKTWVNLNADLRFLEKRDAFIWASERSGRKHLYLYDLNGKLLHAISGGDWEIDNLLAVDEKAGRVYVHSNRDAVIDKQIYALALDGGSADRPRRISQADGWHDAKFAEHGELYVDAWSDPNTPPQVSIRRTDGTLLTWLEHNELNDQHPYAPYLATHLPMEFGTLPAADGQMLQYSMIKPAGFDPAKRYPVFVYVYGGPTVQVVARKWGGLFEQYMAQQGYIVFSIDNRGSARRERRFADALYRHFGSVEVDDQLAGIDWLNKQRFVDGKRIGVFGWSYGGYMAVSLLAAGSDRIAAGVAGAPVTDWQLYDTHYTERYLGDPKENAEGYKQSGVFAHLGGLRSPLLLLHGMADDNVLFTNSTRLISDLTSRGVLFELMTYPGAKHGFATRANKMHRDRMIEAFFAKHLGTAPH